MIARTPVRNGVLERVDNVKRGRGRPKLTWDELVKRDLKDWNISKEIALDRSAWRLAISMPEPWPLCLLGFISSLPQLAWDKRLCCCCCWLSGYYFTIEAWDICRFDLMGKCLPCSKLSDPMAHLSGLLTVGWISATPLWGASHFEAHLCQKDLKYPESTTETETINIHVFLTLDWRHSRTIRWKSRGKKSKSSWSKTTPA